MEKLDEVIAQYKDGSITYIEMVGWILANLPGSENVEIHNHTTQHRAVDNSWDIHTAVYMITEKF